jgi:hypothetical protein
MSQGRATTAASFGKRRLATEEPARCERVARTAESRAQDELGDLLPPLDRAEPWRAEGEAVISMSCGASRVFAL